jgi:hypothetical protein
MDFGPFEKSISHAKFTNPLATDIRLPPCALMA